MHIESSITGNVRLLAKANYVPLVTIDLENVKNLSGIS
jgi:hypothetical protein